VKVGRLATRPPDGTKKLVISDVLAVRGIF